MGPGVARFRATTSSMNSNAILHVIHLSFAKNNPLKWFIVYLGAQYCSLYTHAILWPDPVTKMLSSLAMSEQSTELGSCAWKIEPPNGLFQAITAWSFPVERNHELECAYLWIGLGYTHQSRIHTWLIVHMMCAMTIDTSWLAPLHSALLTYHCSNCCVSTTSNQYDCHIPNGYKRWLWVACQRINITCKHIATK